MEEISALFVSCITAVPTLVSLAIEHRLANYVNLLY